MIFKTRTEKKYLAILLAALLLTAFSLVILFQYNTFSLMILLSGEESVILEYGDAYQEPGAELYLVGSKFFTEGIPLGTSRLKIDDNICFDLLGRYHVTYQASLGKLQEMSQRQVSIVDTVCPVITLTEDPTAFFHPEKGYQEAGVTAFDNYDGDISDRVVCVPSEGMMLYSVIDSSGNPCYAERKVYTHDFIPPEIFLEGGSPYLMAAGFPYSEPGYSASDNYDEDLTAFVQIEGSVNWYIPGKYTLTYSVMDSFQNITTAERIVEVVKADEPAVEWPTGKTVYLTFDDGPSPHTARLLDILDKYGAKATFFVMNGEYNDLIKEISDRGHSVGIHTMTHDYYDIYTSPEAFFADLRAVQQIIYEQTGKYTTLMRFPGGSSNTVSVYIRSGLMTILSRAVRDAGFQYFDWNVDSEDTSSATTTGAVVRNVIDGISENNTSLVLQHDIHGFSVDAVEQILAWGTENGYQFEALTENSPGFHHDLRN